MNIYLVTSGSYSDYQICNAFAREEDAKAYAATMYDGDVEEYELHEGPIERRTWHTLLWRTATPDHEATPGRLPNPSEHAEKRDFDGQPGHAEHQWDSTAVGKLLRVGGWDLRRVRKVYSEQRAQFEARRAGLT